ncbi:MAG: YciI family protein [Gaiellaceae bacterium]
MQYALLIYSDESGWESLSEADRQALHAEYDSFTGALVASGAIRGGDQLQGASAATTVRIRDGESLVTDGPFAETKETLGGYYLIDVESLDDAIGWAAKIPCARHGSIEVRPVVAREGTA